MNPSGANDRWRWRRGRVGERIEVSPVPPLVDRLNEKGGRGELEFLVAEFDKMVGERRYGP